MSRKRVCEDVSPEMTPKRPKLTDEAEHKKLGKLSKFRISKVTRKSLKSRGIKYLFPIQYSSYDHVYDGKDVIGQARTGTGKTLSFALPLVEKLTSDDNELRDIRGRPPLVLVMAPTRELAIQVADEFKALTTKLSITCIYGGAMYEPQEYALRSGLDILVGTPGRILDHMHRGTLSLKSVNHMVLDEADQMLERGFAESVEEVLDEVFHNRQMKPQLLLFSATIPAWVNKTASKYMNPDKEVVDMIGRDKVKTAIAVEHKAIKCPYLERAATIADILQVYSGNSGRAMVFTSTKIEANELALNAVLKQDCQVLHGDIPQKQREITLKSFREGKFRCLVATDVAARGLDIPEVDLVVQCEPPKDLDAYIHRSGRTGRAGRNGICVMFYKPNQEYLIRSVENRAGIKIQYIGAPQAGDIITAAADDSIKCLEKVSPSVLPYFNTAAEKLIEERGAVEVVSAALAYISGVTEMKSRSLLSSQPGFTTYHLCSSAEFRGPGYMWKVIREHFPLELKDAIRGMRMCKDSKGVVFDLPNGFNEIVKNQWKDSDRTFLKIPQQLPELQERADGGYNRQYGGGWDRQYQQQHSQRRRTDGHYNHQHWHSRH
ncbi:nucleolar RNA helicase 2-like isoform X2 [Dysidea avara]|uniref:nucleolar RNA helicase 2-like isoform X2 n=1 Tax=Dysidea avara TaxID=196820 RepID=UPI00331CEAF4